MHNLAGPSATMVRAVLAASEGKEIIERVADHLVRAPPVESRLCRLAAGHVQTDAVEEALQVPTQGITSRELAGLPRRLAVSSRQLSFPSSSTPAQANRQCGWLTLALIGQVARSASAGVRPPHDALPQLQLINEH
jgi:hypothetical protein